MNKNTKKIVIVIVVVALLVAAYIYRDKIKALFAGKKKDSDSVEQKFAAATAVNDTATATTVTPTDTTASASPSAPNANAGSTSAGNGVSYSNSARTITIDGVTYGFASASQVKTMQTNLMQGLTAYATNTGNSNAKILAQAMKSAGGADGVIGKATAAAFAFAARNLPTSVSSYKK